MIDAWPQVYQNGVAPAHRSRMNAPFRVCGGDAQVEARFTREATAASLHQVFGHPRFGGQRITLYNGVTDEAVDAVVAFMEAFAQTI